MCNSQPKATDDDISTPQGAPDPDHLHRSCDTCRLNGGACQGRDSHDFELRLWAGGGDDLGGGHGDLRNGDDTIHSVVADDGSFHSDGLDTNDKFTMTFTKAGKIAYHCGLHPFMKGDIVVQ